VADRPVLREVGQGVTGKLARVPSEAPHDLDAEASVLGAILLGGAKLIDSLVTEEGLRPEHFYRSEHGLIFRAMLKLEREGDGIDPLTVAGELGNSYLPNGGRAELDRLTGVVPAVGNVRSYARTVRENAKWRSRLDGCLSGLEAISSADEEAFAAAQALMDQAESTPGEGLATPEKLADDFWDWLANPESAVIATPFPRLNELLLGGLRPGGTTILAGWTSMGKSTIGDQFLEHARSEGHSACAYINEMSKEERVARTLAARTGVGFDKILGRDMAPREWKRVVNELPNLPFAICPCAGWSAEDVARHVRRHRFDLWMIDLATQLPAGTTAEWSEVSRQLTIAARQSETHGIIVVQLNQTRNDGAGRPHPALRDLKWTGAWADDAPNVIFVHRDDVEVTTGVFEPGADGYARLAKARNGRPGIVPLTLDPYRMRFEDPNSYRVPLTEVIAP
jgi:replicative DNA helicase